MAMDSEDDLSEVSSFADDDGDLDYEENSPPSTPERKKPAKKQTAKPPSSPPKKKARSVLSPARTSRAPLSSLSTNSPARSSRSSRVEYTGVQSEDVVKMIKTMTTEDSKSYIKKYIFPMIQGKKPTLPSKDIFEQVTMPVNPSIEQLKLLLTEHIAQAPAVGPELCRQLEKIGERGFFYQEPIHFSTNANSYYRLHMSIIDKPVGYHGARRSDINDSLPVMERTLENEKLMKQFVESIFSLLENLGMKSKYRNLVSIYILRYTARCGMGTHADSADKLCRVLYMMRLIISVGASRKVEFSVYQVEKSEKDESDGEKNKGKKVKDVGFTVRTKPGVDAYLTSPFSSGRAVTGWTDGTHTTGYVAKHTVPRQRHGAGTTVSAVVDFPLGTIAEVVQVLSLVRGSVLGN